MCWEQFQGTGASLLCSHKVELSCRNAWSCSHPSTVTVLTVWYGPIQQTRWCSTAQVHPWGQRVGITQTASPITWCELPSCTVCFCWCHSHSTFYLLRMRYPRAASPEFMRLSHLWIASLTPSKSIQVTRNCSLPFIWQLYMADQFCRSIMGRPMTQSFTVLPWVCRYILLFAFANSSNSFL